MSEWSIITIILVLYILPAYIAYKGIQKDYSKGGIYENLDIESQEIYIVIVPLLNIGQCFAMICRKLTKKDLPNKFFRRK